MLGACWEPYLDFLVKYQTGSPSQPYWPRYIRDRVAQWIEMHRKLLVISSAVVPRDLDAAVALLRGSICERVPLGTRVLAFACARVLIRENAPPPLEIATYHEVATYLEVAGGLSWPILRNYQDVLSQTGDIRDDVRFALQGCLANFKYRSIELSAQGEDPTSKPIVVQIPSSELQRAVDFLTQYRDVDYGPLELIRFDADDRM